jgi:hypothetical protein
LTLTNPSSRPPPPQNPAYFYFAGSGATIYLDQIELFGGDGTANYFPTAKIFSTDESNSAGGTLRPHALLPLLL